MISSEQKLTSGEGEPLTALRLAFDKLRDGRKMIIGVVYLSLLLDNVLLTMVVPIVPDFLINADRKEGEIKRLQNQGYQKTYQPQPKSHPNLEFNVSTASKFDLSQPPNPGIETEIFAFEVDSENGRVGLLLSSKAIVQLLLNPVVGIVTAKVGYHLPLFLGNFTLLLSALMFAVGEEYPTLFLARSLQGVASACIGVTGMCLVAERYPNEPDRSKMMGFVLGSVAIGVLIGYPLGGFMYDFLGKAAPFIIVSVFICLDGALQLFALDLKPMVEEMPEGTGWFGLLSDTLVLLTGGAIGISTSAMAILEPCLPIWLMVHIKPKKWQLGTAFIPDSVGYVVGTNSFGIIAYRVGRSRVAVAAMVLVGISAFMIPVAKTMLQLIVPHFLLGLGIGVVDAALVPLLASLVDTRHSAHYGSVYAMQQIAVSLAYSLGPMIGGEIVRAVGFPWLMRSIGLVNILYSPLLIRLGRQITQNESPNHESVVNYQREEGRYQQFYDSDDSE